MAETLEFWKMEGLGNDYLYFRADMPREPDWAALAVRLCDRHFGVGADGIITVKREPGVDARMRIYNADGSEAEMCGNGLRALAKWLFDHQMAGLKQVIGTAAGLRYPTVVDEVNGRARLIRVDMGPPDFSAENTGGPVWEQSLTVAGETFEVSAVSMGNPHLVIFGPCWSSSDMARRGPLWEQHPRFPHRINVHSVEIVTDSHFLMRHWERGAGLTLACGTGVAGAAALAIRSGRVRSPVTVDVPGGRLQVEWTGNLTDPVYLTGPSEEVFHGFWEMNS